MTGTTTNAFARGTELRAQGHPTEAIEAFRQALNEGGDTIPALVGISAAYLDLGQNEKAWQLLLSAVASLPPAAHSHPAAAMAFGYLGIASARTGRIQAARDAFGNSLQEDDGNWIYADPEARQLVNSVWTLDGTVPPEPQRNPHDGGGEA